LLSLCVVLTTTEGGPANQGTVQSEPFLRSNLG